MGLFESNGKEKEDEDREEIRRRIEEIENKINKSKSSEKSTNKSLKRLKDQIKGYKEKSSGAKEVSSQTISPNKLENEANEKIESHARAKNKSTQGRSESERRYFDEKEREETKETRSESWVEPRKRRGESYEGGNHPYEVERLSTGVIGLDDKMEGGFVKGSMNFVTGKTGTGKTAFSASFLRKGAVNNEPGVYVTTEEREKDIKEDIRAMFGWDLDALEDRGIIKILSIEPLFPSKQIENLNRLVRSYISNLLDKVMEAIERTRAQRVVIDSVSIIEMFISDEYMSRVALASLLNNLREAGVTAILTGTVPESSEGLSGGGIIEFLVDSVIKLDFVPVAEEHRRTLTIRKMRRTDHSVMILPFDISEEGLRVSRLE